MPARRRGPAALHPAVSVRFSPVQAAYLQLLAERLDVTLSEAVRSCVDESLRQEQPVDGIYVNGEAAPLELVLGLGEVRPDPQWLQRHGTPSGDEQ